MLRILMIMTLIASNFTSYAQAAAVAEQQHSYSARQLTAADLGPWLDGFMANEMQTNKIAGAVVVVVKDGQILLNKGYGFSDVAAKKQVDPDTTLFQPASITKLFTWTAVMQQVEAGKINLDADINTYLDFKIVGKGGKPITMRHLMTHTAGFEEYLKDALYNDPKNVEPLAQFIKKYTPARIFPPGETPAYSNYGAALAGYIVQRVSGMAYDSYIDQHIFKPLGMIHSTTHQPMPAALRSYMSKGYDSVDEDAKPHQFMSDGPAGTLVSSGPDMARFMIAHLQDERAGGMVLASETAKLMHRTKKCAFTQLNCMLLGFMENNINGHNVIAHGGDLAWFHSDLNLFIDDNVGVFISLNSAGLGKSDTRKNLLQSFGDRYFPKGASAPAFDQKIARLHSEQIAGNYLWSRRSDSSFGKFANIMLQATLTPEEDGTLSFAIGPIHYKFREIKPYLWQEVNGNERLSVVMESDSVKRMSINYLSPYVTFEPVKFWQSTLFLAISIPLALGVILMSLLSWPATIFLRRRYGTVHEWRLGEKPAFFGKHAANALLLSSAVIWGLLFARIPAGISQADNGQILFTQIFSMISAILALILVVIYVRWSTKSPMSKGGKFLLIIWLAAIAYLLLIYLNSNFFKIGTDF
jgi:CubicO group peptidase (beta-lactamase class C family)